MDLFANLATGFAVALTIDNLALCLLGVTLGTLVGVLPGLPPLTTIAILLPVTFHLDPTSALIMLAGIYYGAQYGGSQTAILLNLPGTTSHAVTALEGYEMSKRGKAAIAIVTATLASFFGGCFATVVVMTLAPALASVALRFGAADYFSLMLLGLMSASALARGSFAKGVAMVVVGLLLGLVGLDVNSGAIRLSFGLDGLSDGINFVALAMGLFGVSEIILRLEAGDNAEVTTLRLRWREMLPSWDTLKHCLPSVIRGSIIGAVLGILPGAGPTVSSFVSYTVEKKFAKRRANFGQGAVEGIAGPESANNSASQTSFIPTLTLGLPGDATMALMLGALMIHGIAPGPQVMTEHPNLFWGLVASMWIGNLFLLILNLPLVGIWVRLLTIPYRLLYPAVLMFIVIGVYSIGNSGFDVLLTAAFGIAGYIFAKLECEPAPLLLGFILGPLMEENMRRALLISHGDMTVFVTEPISLVLLIITTALVAFAAFRPAMARRRVQS